MKSEKTTETERQNFTAAELLARKTTFHKGLIDIVKKHHRVIRGFAKLKKFQK